MRYWARRAILITEKETSLSARIDRNQFSDRLDEEKRRGITTMNLGFAARSARWTAPGELSICLAAERFVKTMVAGAAGN